MRGDLANARPNMLKRWYDQDLYGAIRRAKAGKPSFILRYGPYANSNIHIHSVQRILKDIIIKSRASPVDSPMCRVGLPRSATSKLKVEGMRLANRAKVSAAEFRASAANTPRRNRSAEDRLHPVLGVLGDWEHH